MRNQGLSNLEILITGIFLIAIALISIPKLAQSASNGDKKCCATNLEMLDYATGQLLEANQADHELTESEWIVRVLGTPERPSEFFPDGPLRCPLGGNYYYNSKNHRVGCTHWQ